jgi:hypothetical protein
MMNASSKTQVLPKEKITQRKTDRKIDMYVKIMSDENKADKDISKKYLLLECKAVSFSRSLPVAPDGRPIENERGYPIAIVDGDEYRITGNVYVLNDAGKTVDAYWPT